MNSVPFAIVQNIPVTGALIEATLSAVQNGTSVNYSYSDLVNAAQNEAAIAMIKARLNMIDKLQEKTLYDGQSEYYRNLQ